MNNNYYITTPIYYVNDKPHIGHAYTSLACDVMCRFQTLAGFDTYFLTGTDEHGQKIEQAADKNNITPQQLVDRFSDNFKQLATIFNIKHDDFIRTTEPRHKQAVQVFWQRLQEKNAIYLDKYSGWYAVRDEAFYTDKQITTNDKSEKIAIASGAPVEWVEEESYFFRLSDYQERLLKYYQDNPDFIMPKTRRNEVISFVKSGLRDLSISRTSFSWGVPVPNDDKHIMYVWLDALFNYVSALGYETDDDSNYKNYWPADLHMVGKDIVIFHAVYWPAMLMAADLPLPNRIFAHGWWTNEGQKISKSLGNVIDPLQLLESYGLDQTRYFLMREVSFGQDGDFSHDAMVRRSNSDLANDLGNLCQRSLTMLVKHCDSEIKVGLVVDDPRYRTSLIEPANALHQKVSAHMQVQAFHKALAEIFAVVSETNCYIDSKAPWALRKTDPVLMQQVLSVIAEIIRRVAILLQPFMPDAATKILDMLNIPATKEARDFTAFDTPLIDGHRINPPVIIFPRIET